MEIEKYIEIELSKLDKLDKHDFVQGQKYALNNVLTQLRLHVVSSSFPSKEAMFIEELQRYNLEKEWDERVNRSDFSKGFISCYKWITNQEFKVR